MNPIQKRNIMTPDNTMNFDMQGRSVFVILLFSLMTIFLVGSHQIAAASECTALADIPLEIRGQAAPGLIHLVWDASTSMQDTILTEDDAYWVTANYPVYSVFPEPKNEYRSLDAKYRHHWKTQWFGHNVMYYNPEVTYTPWSRWNTLACGSGTLNANPDTPRCHPIQNHGTFKLNDLFYKFGGNVSITFSHYFIRNENGETFLIHIDGNSASIKYYKATLSANGKTADALTLMTTQAAKTAGIFRPSYTEERQNFANWYQFYRKRYYTGIAAAGQFIDGWTNIFMRISSFPQKDGNYDNLKRIVSPIDMIVNDTYYDEKDEVLCTLYNSPMPLGGTPLREGLYEAGKFFEFGHDWSSLTGQSPHRKYTNTHLMPYFLPEYGGECQQAFAVVMTDGWWNGDLQNSDEKIIGNSDANTSNPYDGGVFGDDYSYTAADIAMHFYKRDLKPFPETGNPERGLKDFVPTSAIDSATHQHMVTYGISFGMPGSFTPEERNKFAPDLRYGKKPAGWDKWPKPIKNTNTTIDDLWHATINGRGDFFSVNNPEKLVEAMAKIKSDIEERLGSAAAVSTNSVQRRVDTLLFQGQFHSGRWSGDLLALAVNPDTGQIAKTAWSASEKLDSISSDDRVIFTYNGTAGCAFRAPIEGLTASQVDYLRGNRSLELQNGGSFRNRDGKLGDIVHSEPVYHEGVVYVGANDGMLHGFDAKTGKELFAFIPGIVSENMDLLTDPDYRYQYYVDGGLFVQRVGTATLLVGGLNRGGKGYYAIDVTNAKKAIESDAEDFVKWEYTAAEDDDLGYSYSQPLIMKTEAAGWVVVFGNGYNSVNGNAVLYVLDVDDEDGSLINSHKIITAESGCNGIVADITGIDPDFDGYADFVYAGDLEGNLWKFDFRGAEVTDWGVSYKKDGDNKPLFTARNSEDEVQPITVAPSVMMHCGQPGYMLIFGTGKHASEADFVNSDVQTIYGIWDWESAWEAREGKKGAGDDKYLGVFTSDDKDRQLSNLRQNADLPEALRKLTLLKQKVVSQTDKWLIISDHSIKWWNHKTVQGNHIGWYFDLPKSGERVIINPMIRSGTAIVVGSIPSKSPCTGGGTSVLYALDACSGGEPDQPHFDSDKDGDVDETDRIGGKSPGGKEIDDVVAGITDLPPDTIGATLGSGGLDILNVPSAPQGISYWYETDFGW